MTELTKREFAREHGTARTTVFLFFSSTREPIWLIFWILRAVLIRHILGPKNYWALKPFFPSFTDLLWQIRAPGQKIDPPEIIVRLFLSGESCSRLKKTPVNRGGRP